MNRFPVIKYLLALLDRREKTQLTALIVMMGIGTGLEMLGIGVILPFIVILSRPEIIEQNRVLSWAYRFLDIEQAAGTQKIKDPSEQFAWMLKTGKLTH